MVSSPRFLDLFAGAGGLSEGFIRAGFSPIAHVEVDEAACFTLKTRSAYHWLSKIGRLDDYNDYLLNRITRQELYSRVPQELLSSVIHQEISNKTIRGIFNQLDSILKNQALDLIIGGPPCQAYSLIGRSCKKDRMQGDDRNYLYIQYAQFLDRYKPKYFVFENVLGLLSAKDASGRLYFDQMRELFKKIGYSVEYKVLSCEEYEVPQSRKRIILVGQIGKKIGFYPELDMRPSKLKINDLFHDLPKIQSGEGTLSAINLRKKANKWLYETKIRNDSVPLTFHQARQNNALDLEIYEIAARLWSDKEQRLEYNQLPERLKTHQQRSSFLDRFKVVAGNLTHSHTVVAHIAKDGHYYIHPDAKQNRSITPREAARIQTFPDDYYFESVSGKPSRTAAYKQIGNAVPVLLSEKIALKLKEQWHV